MEKICRVMTYDRTLDQDAWAVTDRCLLLSNLVRKGVARVSSPVMSRVISSSLLCCQRQMCRSSSEIVLRIIVQLTMNILLIVFEAEERPEDAPGKMRIAAGNLNVLAVICFSLMQDLRQADEDHIDCTLEVLAVGRHFAIAALRHGMPEVANMQNTGSRIWHDTLKSILAVQTRQNVKLTKMKCEALRGWREYGAVFGWKVGVRVTSTINQPSKTSDDPRYWKIPKRCLSNACACSGHAAFHPMRVCRECWPVLYCSQQCQQSDWAAGHRLVCKSYYS